jgi:hypothetical protein
MQQDNQRKTNLSQCSGYLFFTFGYGRSDKDVSLLCINQTLGFLLVYLLLREAARTLYHLFEWVISKEHVTHSGTWHIVDANILAYTKEVFVGSFER